MESVWHKNTEKKHFPPLNRSIRTDVLIIGGGIVGILCAYTLCERGVDCVLVEAEEIGGGITQNSTAKITFQHGLIYAKLLKSVGPEKAKQYLEANRRALNRYRTICETVDCDFEEKDAYVYSLTDEKKIRDEISALKQVGYAAAFVSSLPLPFRVAGAVKFTRQAQFNPLKFLYAISRDLPIYEHTRVRELRGNTIVAGKGEITANSIIAATHFPFINKHGLYPFKLYQHRSYVIALEGAPDVGGMIVDEAMKGMSFRNYKNLLLIGGGDHRTGKHGGNWDELRRFAEKHYPDAKERYAWAAQDCMSLDGVPYIGLYSKKTPHFYVATGFNKWGFTSAMAAADILADKITGQKNPFAPVFNPSRSMWKPQLAVNAFEAIGNLLTISSRRCPHMGCALKWNEAEHTWDCPCHGSRFTENGRLIDNPATGDLPKKHHG